MDRNINTASTATVQVTTALVDALHAAARVTHVEHGGAELSILLSQIAPGRDCRTPRTLDESGVYDSIGDGAVSGNLNTSEQQRVCSFARHVADQLDARDAEIATMRVQLETERRRVREAEAHLGAARDDAQRHRDEAQLARTRAEERLERERNLSRRVKELELEIACANGAHERQLYAARLRAEELQRELDEIRDAEADEADRDRRAARKERVRRRVLRHTPAGYVPDTDVVDLDEGRPTQQIAPETLAECQAGGGR